MKQKFRVSINSFEEVLEVPHGWTDGDYRDLLRCLEVEVGDEISETELHELSVMALQDLEETEATECVLANRLSDVLLPGQIQNCAQELRAERLWEIYPDPVTHRRFFLCASLLAKVFPKVFAAPEAAKVDLKVQTGEETRCLRDPVDEALVLRLLAAGMDDRSILVRLFEEQLKAGPFSEAQQILWDCNTVRADGRSADLVAYSSVYWMRGLLAEGAYDAVIQLKQANE